MLHTLECPRCHTDFSETKKALDGQELAFCLKCQFPLILIAGKYRLESVLAEGGHGVVYKARHIYLRQDALRVVKILKSSVFDVPGMQTRFIREVQVTSALSQKDEHIVRIYDDFGTLPNMGPFYVMEFLEGTRLDHFLAQQDRLIPLTFIVHIMKQLCTAMEYAHASDIIHRDLKPENLFLTHRKEEPYFLKVLDFGIAKPINQNEFNITHGVLGTPYYMSPEQCLNLPMDARTDVYSMGCILYEMLTGAPPFHERHNNVGSDSLVGLLGAHIRQEPIPPSTLQPDRISPELERVVLCALAKEPEQRFRSAQPFFEALYNALPEIVEIASTHARMQWNTCLQSHVSDGEQTLEQTGVWTSSTQQFQDLSEISKHTSGELHTEQLKFSEPLPEVYRIAEVDEHARAVETIHYEEGVRHYRWMWGMILCLVVGITGGWLWMRKSPTRAIRKVQIRTISRLKPQYTKTMIEPRKRSVRVPIQRHTSIYQKKHRNPPKRPDRRTARNTHLRRKVHRARQQRRKPLPVRATLIHVQKRTRPVRKRPIFRIIVPPVKGCPRAEPSTRWVRLRVRPSTIATGVKVIQGRAHIVRVGGGFCLKLKTSIQVLIEAPEHRACSFALPFRNRSLPILLKKEVIDDIEENRSYCIR